MVKKVVLCGTKECGCCPEVQLREGEVRLGEGENWVRLTREEWNTLVEKIKAGELGEL